MNIECMKLHFLPLLLYFAVLPQRKFGPNVKNPPKIRFLKIVKLKDHFYVCNSLTHFLQKNARIRCLEMEVMSICWNFIDKNREITIFKWTYFRRILAIWSHCAVESQVELEPTPRERNKCMYYISMCVRNGIRSLATV